MGDISGRPKAPEPQIVYVPQYVTQTSSTVASTSADSNVEESVSTPEKEREKGLLSRSRSRLGTILTGFRGILAPNEAQSQRKTLLGE